MGCKHDWKIDPMFANGAVMMFFGKIGQVKREMRYFCNKCGGVKYE